MMKASLRGMLGSSLAAGIFLAACGSANEVSSSEPLAQAELETRSKPILLADQFEFRDLNANGVLDPYEDWRLSAEARAADLSSRMTLEEKAGMMLIATHNPDCDGSITGSGRALIEEQHMSRFILRASVTKEPADCSVRLEGWRLRGGYNQTPRQFAAFINSVQEAREATRLGIPALFKDNPRNHVENQPLFGIGVGAGALSEFPKPAGLAAAALGAGAPPDEEGAIPDDLQADLGVIAEFAAVMGSEWRALGLRGLYGYTIDLATEPRWSRIHETFSENADLTAGIVSTLVTSLQGPIQPNGLALSEQTDVSLTVKHFPGGGPQLMGWDPHYTFGKSQVYTSDEEAYGFGYHLAPFKAAIDAGVGAIMPYYGVPKEAFYEGEQIAELGMAFSEQIITDLLREKLGFKGYVNSDSGIVQERSWGLEDFRTNPDTGEAFDIDDRILASVKVGTDVFSEFQNIEPILDLVASGRLNEERDLDPAVQRLLVEQFSLGLFEDPYVDVDGVDAIVGSDQNREKGFDLQRKSIVLLRNQTSETGSPLLPLQTGQSLYVMGFDPEDLQDRGFNVTDGNYDAEAGATRPPVPPATDVAVLNVSIRTSGTFGYRSNDPKMGGREIGPEFDLIDERTGEKQSSWSAQDPCVYREPAEGGTVECLDNMLIFGGPFPWEINDLSLSQMAKAESWSMSPSLSDIQGVISEIGDPEKVVVSIEFRNPYVLDVESGVPEAGALFATFGVSDAAQLDILTGTVNPQGRLPFALPRTEAAIVEQAPDAPGYDETTDGALYPFGHGLGYAEH